MSEHDRDNTPTAPLTLGRSFWAIDPEMLPRLIEAHRARHTLDRLAPRFTAATPRAARRSSSRAGGAVAVIPLTGVITPRSSFLSFLFGGGGGLIDFRDSFREAVNDPDVGAIVLDVDSPGGLVDLVPETAAEILASRGSKPIVAVSNTIAASAAYWIASQADEFVVTPSGSAGSIGVYMVHEDYSGWNDQKGIAPTYISAGKYKVEGNPDEPLSDEARADWQQEVDDLYGMFVNAVAAGRGVSASEVRAGYGEGRTLLAERAFQANLVDRIDTIESVIGDLLAPSSSGAGATGQAGDVTVKLDLAFDDEAFRQFDERLRAVELFRSGRFSGPLPKHDTKVVDQPWDGPAQVKKLKTPITKSVAEAMFAWADMNAADPDGDGWPDAKSAHKFPHHMVDDAGKPGAANVNGVRNGLARIDAANIPEGDKAGVRAHLQHHLDAFNGSNASDVSAAPEAEDRAAIAALLTD